MATPLPYLSVPELLNGRGIPTVKLGQQGSHGLTMFLVKLRYQLNLIHKHTGGHLIWV